MKNAGLESGGPNIGLGKRKKNCQSCHLPVPLANNPSFSSSVFLVLSIILVLVLVMVLAAFSF